MQRRIWQVGTGDDARPYDQYLFDHDVVLLGSGTDGEWSADNPAYAKRSDIRAFADRAEVGDLVVARRGLRLALGLGVLGKYAWSPAFDDIEGWDLQHYRRVRWLATREKRFARSVFPQRRFSKSRNEEVAGWVNEIAGRAATLAPPDEDELSFLPPEEKALDTSMLDQSLCSIIERVTHWKAEIWNGNFGAVPSEDELLTHVTVPLLEALGWEPEQIAVKWNYTDLALFHPKRREPANCRMVVEGKRIGAGLRWAEDQARRYATERELTGADLLVTDGIRFRLHRATDYSDETALGANFGCPKQSATKLFEALRHP